MKPIILASASKQRKKLLSFLGVKFVVKPSRVDELTKIKTNCADLVKENALIKASDVASRLKKGIVIGADTVVYVGNKRMIGKPHSFQEAKDILKVLFSKPSWVYTGVVVIDVESKKKIISHEKTKVFMSHLSDLEIDRYHRRCSPFDKAGGFDIEGSGSVFIHRIEGCYTNVIGLPMAKLYSMLKKVGVQLLGLLVVLNLTACTTEYNLATEKQERYLYGNDKEIAIGESVAAQMDKHYDVIEDIDVNERAERILDRIVEVSDRKDLVYFIKVIDVKEEDKEKFDDEPIINALALPGGYIYLYKDLVDLVENDDQLAGVIAHEVGHITAKHAIKRLQAAYGGMLLQVLSIQASNEVAAGTNLALTSLFFENSREAELEADRLGAKYMKKAGYDPKEMVTFLEMLEKQETKQKVRAFSIWKTHPDMPLRKASLRKEISGKLEFRDYLIMTGEDKF